MSHNDIIKGTSVYREFKTQDQRRDESVYIDTECKHHYWTKRCSHCKTILESESQINKEPGESIRISFNELDHLVCSFNLALKLQDARILQRSKMYWVLKIDTKVLSLRTKKNATIKEAKIASAFTVTELVKIINKLPSKVMKATDYEYIGRNAMDPNRVGRLLLKYAEHLKD